MPHLSVEFISCIRAVGLNLECALASPGGLVQPNCWAPSPEFLMQPIWGRLASSYQCWSRAHALRTTALNELDSVSFIHLKKLLSMELSNVQDLL